MEALYVLLIFSLLLGCGFLLAFFWAHGSGQFDDAETPALRMLFDDTRERSPSARLKTADTQSLPKQNTGGT